MIYNSVDIIPAKIYFKILETGDLTLLSTKNKSIKKLKSIWLNIQDQNDKITPDKNIVKEINIYTQIERISAKQTGIQLALNALKLDVNNKDEQLIDLLKFYGHKFSYEKFKEVEKRQKQYLSDLKKIETENKTETVRIENLKEQIPKKDTNNQKESTLDDVIINYAAIAGFGFVDTNKITLSQYYSLVKAGNQKIKSIENGKG